MSVNSVNSGSTYASHTQMQPQIHSDGIVEKMNGYDSGDIAAAAAVNAAPRPTVNTSGQTIGAIINIQA